MCIRDRSIHQQKSTAKMSVFQPLITEIQQKYKNNPQKQQEELMLSLIHI